MRLRPVWTLLLVPVLAASAAILPASATRPVSASRPSAANLPAASVEGTVRDAATGAAIEGANVSVVGTALGASTDTDGRFTLSGAEAGAVEIRVTHVGHAAHTERVVLRDDETTRLEVRLSATEVEVVVADRGRAEGRPAPSRSRTDGAPPPPARMTPPASAPVATSPAGDATLGRESGGTLSETTAEGRDAYDEGTTRPDDRRRTEPRPQQQANLLTAGDIDDGLNWDAFLRYSGRAMQRGSVLNDLRLDDRLTLRIVDRDGQPVAGARVRVEASGGRGARGLTTEAGTDGRLALFPRYDFGAGVDRLEVTATPPGGGASVRRTIDVARVGSDAFETLRLGVRAERPQALDLAVVLDVTGSMGDEHRYLTDEFENIVAQARRRYPDADLRFALVAYRDHGDDFVVRRWDFTRSESVMRERLAQLSADGGGDMPEAMDEALDAMLALDWRTGTAARMAFLVADAPPHANRLTETLAAVREARARGLRLYPLAASGVDASAEHVMRTAAVLTQGRYLWLTDDSGVGNAHAEPNVPCYQVSRVSDLVARVIESELAGRRIEADSQDVIRTVGNPVAGVCGGDAVSQQQNPPRRRGDLGYD